MPFRIVLASVLLCTLSTVTAMAQFGSPAISRGHPFPSMQDDSGPVNDLEIKVQQMDGKAAPDMPVEVRNATSGAVVASGMTGRQGNLNFQNLSPGVYEVLAARGAAEADERVEFRGGTAYVSLRLSAPLQPAENVATVSVAQMKAPPKAQREVQKAKEHIGRKQFGEARAAALKAVEIWPQYAEAYALLGELDLHDGKPNEAAGELEKAVQLDPNSFLALAALGAAYNTQHRFDDALRTLQSALRLAPNSWQAHLQMAQAYLGKGDYAAALRSVDQALALAPPDSYSQTHLLRAEVLLGLKEYEEAAGEYEQFLRRQPQGTEAAQVRQALNHARTLAGDRP
jgi:tetratricopeptide (TPR) repeat protein